MSRRYEPKMEKIMRMHSVTSTIENGFVYLPEKADWLADYLHELTTFPNGKFDDQCDSTSQALHWVKKGRATGNDSDKARNYADHVGPCPFCHITSGSQTLSSCDKHWDRPIRPQSDPGRHDLMVDGVLIWPRGAGYLGLRSWLALITWIGIANCLVRYPIWSPSRAFRQPPSLSHIVSLI